MIFRQLANVAGCVRRFRLAQTCRPIFSEFCPIFTFLLEQQIKFILLLCPVTNRELSFNDLSGTVSKFH